MKVPTIRKLNHNSSALIERALPSEGETYIAKGDVVSHLDKLGSAQMYLKSDRIKFSSNCNVRVGDSVEKGDLLAYKKSFPKLTKREVLSTLTGEVYKVDEEEKTIYIRSYPYQYELISGFEGVVKDVVENRAVLVEGTSMVLNGVCGTIHEGIGELKVIKEFTEGVGRDNLEGKVVVVETINIDDLYMAFELGVSAIFTGGVNSDILTLASNNRFPLLSLSGFGSIPLLKNILDYLKSVQGRFVVLTGITKELLIPDVNPVEEHAEIPISTGMKELEIDDEVQVLIWPFFGWEGKVIKIYDRMVEFESKIKKDAARVKLTQNGEEVDVAMRNIVVLE